MCGRTFSILKSQLLQYEFLCAGALGGGEGDEVGAGGQGGEVEGQAFSPCGDGLVQHFVTCHVAHPQLGTLRRVCGQRHRHLAAGGVGVYPNANGLLIAP